MILFGLFVLPPAVANLLGNLGILLTYDVFITLGLLIAIPISAGEQHAASYALSKLFAV